MFIEQCDRFVCKRLLIYQPDPFIFKQNKKKEILHFKTHSMRNKI